MLIEAGRLKVGLYIRSKNWRIQWGRNEPPVGQHSQFLMVGPLVVYWFPPRGKE